MPRRSAPTRRLDRRRERLVEVRDDVVDVLEPDREPDEVVRHARGRLLLVGQLLVGGRGRMDDQRLRVAHVGQQAEELHVVDEPPAGLAAAPDAEGEHAAEAALQVARRERVGRVDSRPG